MRNSWLAIDAATVPGKRARELRHAWERFVQEGESGARTVRAPIADSWQRSAAAGVDPSGNSLAPMVAEVDEASERWKVHPLAAMAPVVLEILGPMAEESEHLIVVSDAAGVLLWIGGNARVRLAAAESMNFTEGALWSETAAGTNAIGTALAEEHAVQVFAAEHFSEVVQPWTCAAAPVRDPDNNELIGIIDLTGQMATVHPHSLGVAMVTAQTVEAQLAARMQANDVRLRAHYQERLENGGDRRALVTPSGRVIAESPAGWLGERRIELPTGGGELLLPPGVAGVAEPLGHAEAFEVRALDGHASTEPRSVMKLRLLGRDRAQAEIGGKKLKLSRRQSEILALLCLRPAGMTSEELAAEVYGDAGQPGNVRVAVFRLRKLLGRCIATEPYRISCDIDCDLIRVGALLDRGAIRDAAELYEQPLLPHSAAPGVARQRDTIESWLRKSVMAADDVEALWAWLQSYSGHDDLPAWKRFLSELPFHDPRRSLAAAQVVHLRGEASARDN